MNITAENIKMKIGLGYDIRVLFADYLFILI